MARITDGQVRTLFRLLNSEASLSAAAMKTGMDRKSARRYRDMNEVPSEIHRQRDWRTRDGCQVHDRDYWQGNIAAGDVDGDGINDIIIGADAGGGSHFKVFRFNDGNPTEFISEFAFAPGFNGGVRVAAADLAGNGVSDIAIAAGPGAGPHVKVFRYNGSGVDQIVSDWAFQPPTAPGVGYFDSGMYIVAGNVDGTLGDELIVGADAGGGSHVKVFRVTPPSLVEIDSFFAFAAGFNGGARVAAADFNNDGIVDLLAATGPGIEGKVKAFRFLSNHNRQDLGEITPFSGYTGGIFVGG